MKDISIQELQNTATKMRMKVVDMIYKAQSGHPGGSLSAADFVTACYFKYMNVDPQNPRWPDRDRMVLSKGHVCPIQYACLATVGFFPEAELDTLRKEGSKLQGHQAIEDMGILRTIPNIAVIMPADYNSARKLVHQAGVTEGPVYLRFTRDAVPQIYGPEVEFTIGKAHQIQDGKDVAIIANGDTVRLAVEAAKELAAQGLSARVLDMHTIKPLDVEAVTACVNDIGKIITMEDHNILNGLGNYDEIAKVVPEEQIIVGNTAFGATPVSPGHVKHTGYGVTNMGTLKAPMAKVEAAAEAFRAVGLDVTVHENVMNAIWHKLLVNSAINGMSALLETPNGFVAKNQYAHEVARMLVEEGLKVANACGCTLDPDEEMAHVYEVSRDTDATISSMVQDVIHHHETEIRIINGAVCRYGREHGIPTPCNDLLVQLVLAKQSIYLGK